MLAGLMNLDEYRAETEEFSAAIEREYYLHFSGQKESFEIEAVYDAHAGLFSRERVEELRQAGNGTLLEFAVQGLIGRETKAETAALAEREPTLEIEVDGERMPFRSAAVAQSNESDPERRAAIDAARNAMVATELNPLLRILHERGAELALELEFADTVGMCEELSGIDLRALGRETEAFLDATEAEYERIAGPQLERQLGFGFDRLRRSDIPAFFRAPELDAHFPSDRLVPSLMETLAGMGIDAGRQPNVVLDTEQRPTKSPRAFCSPVRVPDEVYLVISPIGGWEDFTALFHEAGHTEHYAHIDAGLPIEDRAFGDNSITEGFAFLFDGVTSSEAWLREVMGVEDAATLVEHARAVELIMLRRYCAKLAYELELHGGGDLDAMPALYAERLSAAVHVDWPPTTWLSDVDEFFYASRYLRAWALERQLRGVLVDRFGPTWFAEREAGRHLCELWRQGQSAPPEELLGVPLDFGALLADVRA
jgi:hypothetical protein